ncbi:hypothetical protein GXP71_00865 [Cellulomonas sp. H30R-01]|uniref:Uncharacterized protein n=1 Tax=Cellulomonas algicola TaxID=2071633 RepID=A0A401UUX4_9CELL|nr:MULTISPECIES: hypothetical protein [Cellulomonas]QHT54790.1 hypothetical protein GXP71_00865 [Cellulomonas sp. H30R-01]GCD18467.1 hypothetical protein CTKZ_00290 [Cellulomonas algicola]
MENDLDGAVPSPRPTPAEARSALADLAADRASLAARVVTPWWYHPTLGAVVALIVCTQALPSPASLVLLPVALFGLPALVVLYRRRYGVWVAEPAGPRSRALYRALIVVLVLVLAATLVVRLTDVAYVWALVPAAVGFVAAVVLGPWYDDAQRRELAAEHPHA